MDSFSNYQEFLGRIKSQIQKARIKAVLSANAQMLELYWWIGNSILNQQNTEGWGAKVISRIAADLKDAFPDMKGISERNLKYMRAFAAAYPSFVQGGLAQDIDGNTSENKNPIMQAPLAQITWYHHISLLDKVKDPQIRDFYIRKTIENGWSRDVMINQLNSGLHLRQGILLHNFNRTLPLSNSDLARELFKDPYKFDFLQLSEEANERELEDALVNHIYKFLLELGKGFAFMGKQFRLEKGGKEYFLDLLFYHTILHSHVIIELKIGEFKPEYSGKMSFYLSAFDDEYRMADDGPTIGIILCKDKNKVTAEYALRDINKPIGIAEYQLTNAIPTDLKSELPSIEELETELEKELEIPKKPIDEKLSKLNNLITKLGQPEVKETLSVERTKTMFNEILIPLKQQLDSILKPVCEMFNESTLSYSINSGSSYLGSADLEADLLTGNDIHEFGLNIFLSGFKRGGVNAFNAQLDLKFFLEKFKYLIGPSRQAIWDQRLYHESWSSEDLQLLAEKWAEQIIDAIQLSAERINLV